MCSRIARTPYRFDHGDEADWIAQHFFTGGIMPSHGLIDALSGSFRGRGGLALEWRALPETALTGSPISTRTRLQIDAILAEVYGADADLWRRRWRLFFLATAGLFGHANGEEWGVSHYRLRPT